MAPGSWRCGAPLPLRWRAQWTLTHLRCGYAPQGATYNASVDVYAFGVLVWELFSQEMPFDGYDIPTAEEKVLSGERPPRHSLARVWCSGYSRTAGTPRDRASKMVDVVPRVEEAMQRCVQQDIAPAAVARCWWAWTWVGLGTR